MFKWTEEIIVKMRKLHFDGLSASRIATSLDKHLSRSAVIGKLNRIGLKNTDRPGKVANRGGWRPKPQKLTLEYARRLDLPVVISEPKFDAPNSLKLSIYDLKETTCRWPYGDAPPFTYCGHNTIDGSPYCLAHWQESVVR